MDMAKTVSVSHELSEGAFHGTKIGSREQVEGPGTLGEMLIKEFHHALVWIFCLFHCI